MELVLPQADKMIHALKKLHIVERCFRTGAERKAAPSALHESKGIFSFAKENIPFDSCSADGAAFLSAPVRKQRSTMWSFFNAWIILSA